MAILAACTSTQSQVESDAAMLPRPQIVVVDTFAVSADEVKLDEGLTTEIEQAVRERHGTSRTQQEIEAGRQVADAIADKLVVEIRDLGPSAERGSALPAGTQNALLIKGQLVSIDEGNRTERVIVGLGAGRSDVRTHVQVYEVTLAAKLGPGCSWQAGATVLSAALPRQREHPDCSAAHIWRTLHCGIDERGTGL